MAQGDLPGNRQSKTGTFTVSAAWCPVETFKNTRQALLREAGTLVFDLDAVIEQL